MKIPKVPKSIERDVKFHQDYFGEHFDNELLCHLDVHLFDEPMTDGFNLEQKIKFFNALGLYLQKASKFFAHVNKTGKYKTARFKV